MVKLEDVWAQIRKYGDKEFTNGRLMRCDGELKNDEMNRGVRFIWD